MDGSEVVGKLRIGWSWGTPDGWQLHRVIKDALWESLESGNINFSTIVGILAIKEDWLDVKDGDKIPVNYPMLIALWKHFLKEYKKFKPPILFRLGIKKIGIFILTLFKEDSAYTERFGGFAQYIITHRAAFPRNKVIRLASLKKMKEWWYTEDWRDRGKDKLAKIWDYVINEYDKTPFVTSTIDFFIDSLLLNADKWNFAVENGVSYFDPVKWYPRGKGQINYICHGRKS